MVENGRIAAIAPAGTLTGAPVTPLHQHLLVPGLVNGHQHSHEHFQRGRTENLPLELWMHLVRTRIPVTPTPRQVYLRTLIGAIESLRTGCTTLVCDTTLGSAIDTERIAAAILAEIEHEYRSLAQRYTEAEASVAPILAAVEPIYRRSLATPIPADTHAARL